MKSCVIMWYKNFWTVVSSMCFFFKIQLELVLFLLNVLLSNLWFLFNHMNIKERIAGKYYIVKICNFFTEQKITKHWMWHTLQFINSTWIDFYEHEKVTWLHPLGAQTSQWNTCACKLYKAHYERWNPKITITITMKDFPKSPLLHCWMN